MDFTSKHVYSPSKDAFYPTAMKVFYEQAGSWPDDAVAVEDAEFLEFSVNDRGRRTRQFVDGKLIWGPAQTT